MAFYYNSKIINEKKTPFCVYQTQNNSMYNLTPDHIDELDI